MNKAELVEVVAAKVGDRRTATVAVETVLDAVQRTVRGGEKVSLFGFGVFEKADRAERTARNPATGGTVQVAAVSVPRFRPGQGFKDVVSGARELPDPPAAAPAPQRQPSARAAAQSPGLPEPVLQPAAGPASPPPGDGPKVAEPADRLAGDAASRATPDRADTRPAGGKADSKKASGGKADSKKASGGKADSKKSAGGKADGKADSKADSKKSGQKATGKKADRKKSDQKATGKKADSKKSSERKASVGQASGKKASGKPVGKGKASDGTSRRKG